MNERQADMVLAGLTAAIERRNPISEAQLRVWEQQLADLDYEAATEAVRTWPRRNRHFPSIHEFRTLTKEIQRRMEVDRQRREAQAAIEATPPLSEEETHAWVEHCKQILRNVGVRV